MEKGFLESRELPNLLHDQSAAGMPIGTLLVQRGILQPSQVVELLREQRRRALFHLFDECADETPEEVLRALTDPSRHLDQYVLIQKLGTGGMGTVWKAWDPLLRRWIAIKILRGEAGSEVRRFLREARAVARLSHPNIVKIHKVAQAEGRPYLVLDYVAGGSLEHRRMEPRAAAHLIAVVARAIEHAHHRGVIHRDLKPANLLVDEAGTVHVTDFGLAMIPTLEAKTATGTLLGTPAYMPPEHARGRRGDARSDVYSLGATLYRLVCGRPPFSGETAETILRVVQEPPLPPRRIRKEIPGSLEAIILKCMEKNPSGRYGTAAELAEDLERFQRGEPILARAVGRVGRLWNRVRRKPIRWAPLLLLLAGFVGWSVRPEKGFPPAAQSPWTEEDSEILRGDLSLARSRPDDYGQAIEAYSRALDDRKEDAVLRLKRGSALQARGRFRASTGSDPSEDYHSAAEDFRLASEFRPTWIDPRLLHGITLHEWGLYQRDHGQDPTPSFEAAIREFSLGVQMDPRRSEARKHRGLTYLDLAFHREHRGRDAGELRSRAREDLAESLRGGRSEHAHAAFALARLQEHEGGDPIPGYAAALDGFSRVLANHPNLLHPLRGRAWTRLHLARVRRARGQDPIPDLQAALEDLDRALKTDPGSAEILTLRGILHVEMADPEAALGDFSRALETNPRCAAAFLRRGLAHLDRSRQRGDPGSDGHAALADFRKALEINPNDAETWIALASAQRMLATVRRMNVRLLEEAVVALTRAIRLNPRSAESRRSRGELLLRLDRIEEAIFDFHAALVLAPRLQGEILPLLARAGVRR